MKVLSVTTASLVMVGTRAMASTAGSDAGGPGLASIIFIAFIAMVILFQFVPGLTMFLRIFKGIFTTEVEQQTKKVARNNRTGL